jgi:hypothetical protein
MIFPYNTVKPRASQGGATLSLKNSQTEKKIILGKYSSSQNETEQRPSSHEYQQGKLEPCLP